MILDVQESGIEVHFNTVVTKEMIEEIKPDALIVPIRSSPFVLPIEGSERAYR